ncbi:MAG: hypothetical protein RMY36_021250 [Nostoc sp. SerVER01]|nr:hypothetical protein [Nostoc sp. SerVER01]MDZ8077944.1 hypothetical protein [Nostoc sp. DcaGUA01]
MNGSPVLDQNSRLITINGGLKYPIQGIIAFIFTSGTMPIPALFKQMEALNLAILIGKFQQLFGHSPNSILGNY